MPNIVTVTLYEDIYQGIADSQYISVTISETVAVIGGGSGANLAYTASPTNGVVTSDTGTDATIPATDGTNAGLFLPAEKTKLSGIETNADVTDATNVSAAGAFMKSVDDTDDITVGVTNKFATQSEKDKLANITVTQAVNLDTIEADSHTHSNKSILDATTASFTTADETKLDGIEALADVTDSGNVGSVVAGVTEKTTPVDADTLPLTDSAAANVLKKLSWSNIKATLKTYFDTLYQAAGSYLTSANITQTITNGVTTNAPSEDAVFDALALKQDTLVSGTNIKTVNSTSLVGSGNVSVQETLVSGTNIKTINGTSVLGSGDIVVSGGGMQLYTPNKFYFKNDYLQIASDGSFGNGNFQNVSSGSGATVSFEVSEKDAQGVVRIQTGTTTTGRGAWWHPKGYNTICLGDNGLKMWFKFKLGEAVPDVTDDYVVRHGIAQNVSGDSANDIVFIIGRGINSGNLSVRYRSASTTRFDLDTTIVPSKSWQECYLEMNASTHVITVYNASGTLLATSSTPATKITNTQLFTMTDNINKIAGTTNRTFYSDYFIMELT